jgi:hypothetical protein
MPVSSSYIDPHGCAGTAGIHPAGSSRPTMGSSLLLDPLLRGKRGACNGLNVHHHGENSNTKSKSPLPGAPNVKVVYNTSPRITTRVERGGSLIGGTKALDAKAG